MVVLVGGRCAEEGIVLDVSRGHTAASVVVQDGQRVDRAESRADAEMISGRPPCRVRYVRRSRLTLIYIRLCRAFVDRPSVTGWGGATPLVSDKDLTNDRARTHERTTSPTNVMPSAINSSTSASIAAAAAADLKATDVSSGDKEGNASSAIYSPENVSPYLAFSCDQHRQKWRFLTLTARITFPHLMQTLDGHLTAFCLTF